MNKVPPLERIRTFFTGKKALPDLELKLSEHESKLQKILSIASNDPDFHREPRVDDDPEPYSPEDFQHDSAFWQKSYEETKNPLFLWSIYRSCRTAGVPVPESVYQYLDSCTDALLSAAEDIHEINVLSKKGGTPLGVSSDVCDHALGLKSKGQHNAFAAYQKHRAWSFIIDAIDDLRSGYISEGLDHKEATSKAITEVHVVLDKVLKEKAPSQSSIRNYYKKYRQ